MTILEIVRKRITLADVLLLHSEEKRNTPTVYNAAQVHTVTFHVAPATDMYEIEELGGFMAGLVPQGTEAYLSSNPHICDDAFRFGRLGFREEIGEIRVTTTREITVADEAFAAGVPHPLEDGRYSLSHVQEVALQRHIGLRVYPSVALGRHCIADNPAPAYSVPLSVISQYCPDSPAYMQQSL